MTNASAAQPGQAGFSLVDWYNDDIMPAVCGQLDQVFPEFGFQRRGSKWQATIVPDGIGVGDPKRIESTGTYDRPKPGFVVHGGMDADCWTWLQWVSGLPAGASVKGETSSPLCARWRPASGSPSPRQMTPRPLHGSKSGGPRLSSGAGLPSSSSRPKTSG